MTRTTLRLQTYLKQINYARISITYYLEQVLHFVSHKQKFYWQQKLVVYWIMWIRLITWINTSHFFDTYKEKHLYPYDYLNKARY